MADSEVTENYSILYTLFMKLYYVLCAPIRDTSGGKIESFTKFLNLDRLVKNLFVYHDIIFIKVKN